VAQALNGRTYDREGKEFRYAEATAGEATERFCCTGAAGIGASMPLGNEGNSKSRVKTVIRKHWRLPR